MTQENILEQVSIRNLQDAGTPLRHFKGRLDSYELSIMQFADDRKDGTKPQRVNLNFTELEVIHSTEPYPFPVATISIKYSNRKRSAWGILSKSLLEFLTENEDFKDCRGRIMEMKFTEGHEFGTNRDQSSPDFGQTIVASLWECVGIEGGGPVVTPMQKALNILNGRTEKDFNDAIMVEPSFKTGEGKEILNQIIAKQFVSALITTGQVTKDANGIHTVVKK